MATLKQIEANRRNAVQSTGPRTAEGKAAARRNALDTGIYAAGETVLPGENPEALAALTEEYYGRFAPHTPEQRCLVDSLVSDEWLLRRFRRIEADVLSEHSPNEERFSLGQSYMSTCITLERLQRRINATRRSFLKTLEALKALQSAEEETPEAPPPSPGALSLVVAPAPEPQPTQPLPTPIGFVPSIPSEPAPVIPTGAGSECQNMRPAKLA